MRILSTAIASATLLVGACSPSPRFVDTACTAFTPITYSAAGDTESTKSQIRGHNAAWSKLCK